MEDNQGDYIVTTTLSVEHLCLEGKCTVTKASLASLQA